MFSKIEIFIISWLPGISSGLLQIDQFEGLFDWYASLFLTLVKKFMAKSSGNGCFCHETQKWIAWILLALKSATLRRVSPFFSALKTTLKFVWFTLELNVAQLHCTAQLPTFSPETSALYAVAVKRATLRHVLPFFQCWKHQFFTRRQSLVGFFP